MRSYYRALGMANKLVNNVEAKLQRTTMVSSPVVVDVVLTKACNFACTFCKDYETPNGAKRVSLSNFERMASQVFPKANRLNICSGGEPYLHTGLTDFLRIAKSYGLYTWVLSNGSIMKPSVVEQVIGENLITEHGFSVDGFRPETVENIRLNADFSQIIKNIDNLINLRDEQKKRNPKITIRYALMRSNIEELPDAVRMWGDKGINEIQCGYLSLTNQMDPTLSLYYHQDLMSRCMEEAKKVAEQYPGLTLSLPPLVAEERKKTNPDNCDQPWRFIMIDTNGEIMPCYRAFEAMRLPSVYDETSAPFQEIFNSDSYQQLRGTANDTSGKNKYFKYCDKCEFRHGWGREESHLGDETWEDSLRSAGNLIDIKIDHKRPVKNKSKPAIATQAAG